MTTFTHADDARQWFALERTNLASAITYAAEHSERARHDAPETR
jgi:hypothetical protein